MSLGAELVGGLDDSLNPLLVRDVRRALRGWFLPIVFGTAQGICLLVCLAASGKAREGVEGIGILTTLLWVLSFLGGVVLPLQAYQWIWQERQAGTYSVLLITRQRVQDLFWGRFAAGMVPLLLILSATAPFLVFAYLLRGVDVGAVLGGVGLVIGLAAFHILCGLSLSFAAGTRAAYATLWWMFGAFTLFSTSAVTSCLVESILDSSVGSALGIAALVGLPAVFLTVVLRVVYRVRHRRVAPASQPVAVEVRGVSRGFGSRWAVHDLSFQIQPGEIVGLLGSNGAGKTTTLRMMATLLAPYRGDIRFGNASVVKTPVEARSRMGFLPDRQGYYTNMTVAEYLDFFARAYGLTGAARRRTVADVLAFSGLESMADRDGVDLSKGMRQRLGFARALIHDPAVLLLDEPMEGLDPRARIEFRELLVALAGQKKSILISSHILAELTGLVDRVVILEEGNLAVDGQVEELTRQMDVVRRLTIGLVDGQSPDAAERFLVLQPAVRRVAVEGRAVHVDLDEAAVEIDRLLHDLFAAGVRFDAVESRRPDLESVYLHHTRGRLA